MTDCTHCWQVSETLRATPEVVTERERCLKCGAGRMLTRQAGPSLFDPRTEFKAT